VTSGSYTTTCNKKPEVEKTKNKLRAYEYDMTAWSQDALAAACV